MNAIPNVTRTLLFLNVIVFIAQMLFEQRGIDLADIFGLHFFMAENFSPIQFVTYMFLHGDWSHLFFNMFALWMFGRIIEQALGTKHFVIYYFVCGVGAGICQEIVQVAEYFISGLNQYDMVRIGTELMRTQDYLSLWTTIGASGAVYGILLAFGFLFPNERIMLIIPPIPMRAKYFVVGYALLELFLSFGSSDNIAHFAHLGGMLFGLLLLLRWTRLHHDAQWWRKLKQHFSVSRPRAPRPRPTMTVYQSSQPTSAETPRQQDVNSETAAQREEKRKRVEQLLDKIKISGYESLTKEEKEFLFSISTKPTSKQGD